MSVANENQATCDKCGAAIAVGETCDQCQIEFEPSRDVNSCDKLKQLVNKPWVLVVLILHVGFLGIPVYWKTSYSLGVRLVMIVVSIVYTVGAVVFIAVMLQWLYRMFFGG